MENALSCDYNIIVVDYRDRKVSNESGKNYDHVEVPTLFHVRVLQLAFAPEILSCH